MCCVCMRTYTHPYLVDDTRGGAKGCCEKREWTNIKCPSSRLLTLPGSLYQCRSDWCPPTEFKLAILDWCASKSSLWVRTQQVHRTFVRVKARRRADPPACPRERGSASSLVHSERKSPFCVPTRSNRETVATNPEFVKRVPEKTSTQVLCLLMSESPLWPMRQS